MSMTYRTFFVPATLIGLSAAAMGLFFVAFDRDWFPLGIPDEWIWATPDVWAEATSEWQLFLAAGVTAASLVAWATWSAGWVERCGRWRFIAAIAVCIVLGAVFQFFCEIAAPTGLQKWAMLHSYSANGFHEAARYYSDDLPEVWHNHAAIIRPLHPHHVSANPPGWILVYGYAIRFFREHPRLAERVWLFSPSEVSWRLRRMSGARAVPADEQAALVAIAALSRLLCFAVAIPAAWLAAARGGRQASLAAASAVLLLPVAPLFAPRCDTIYPTIALAVLALSHYAWQRRSWPAAAVAGVVLGVGTFFSMCFFIIGGMAALYVAAQSLSGKRPTLAAVCAAPIGWLAVVATIYLAGHDSWATWSVNIAKNTEFNQLYRQSYGQWTLVNLLEFGAALGLPVVVFLTGRVAVFRQADPLLCAWLATLAFLDLAGTNRGESCRLWLFMMPIGVLLAVEWLPRLGHPFRLLLGAFLAMQALNCVMLDRDLLLLTDLEQSKARQEAGLSKIKMTEKGMEAPLPAAQLMESDEGGK
jgi:hypothetical protein